MNKILSLLLTLSLFPFAAMAYDGDYVWEVKFKKQLPMAEQGDSAAQYTVGEMYEKGKGVDKDTARAFEWYLKSAKQDNKKATYKVGLSYFKGIGVGKNPDKAIMWLKRASREGYARAHFYVAEMYETGTGSAKNHTKALEYYELAKDGGYGPAVTRIERVKKAKKTSKRRLAVNAAERKRRSAASGAAAARKNLAMNGKAGAIRVSQQTPVAKSTPDRLLLKGGWTRRNKPAEFLPSTATKCKKSGKTIQCVSSKLKRNIGMADIEYETKAVISNIKNNGKFDISYRNNVKKITVTDSEFLESGAKLPVKKGWQDAEHTLACNMENEKSLVCNKDKMRKLKFVR